MCLTVRAKSPKGAIVLNRGADYAREHPEVVVVVVQSAASDWAAARLAIAIEHVAIALAVPAGFSLPRRELYRLAVD